MNNIVSAISQNSVTYKFFSTVLPVIKTGASKPAIGQLSCNYKRSEI